MNAPITPAIHVTPHVRLVERLAHGGMGEVWIADHLTLCTRVAVKLIAQEYVDHQLARARFEREARTAARLDSGHVVRHFDHGVSDQGIPYIVMELLSGETLHDRLAKGPMTLSETIDLIEQVSRALGCAHRLGVVHRDVKPENIFLCDGDDPPFVKVLDFGVATEPALMRARTLTDPGALVGTPSYMSPEAVMGTRGADPLDDIWGLCAVAYEALVGIPAFWGETREAICCAVSQRRYRSPSEVDARFGPEIDALFSKAFAETPGQRFSDAEAFAGALRALDRPPHRLAPFVSDEEATYDDPAPVSVTSAITAPGAGWLQRWGGVAAAAAAMAVGTPLVAWLSTGEPPAGEPQAIVDEGPPPDPAAVSGRVDSRGETQARELLEMQPSTSLRSVSGAEGDEPVPRDEPLAQDEAMPRDEPEASADEPPASSSRDEAGESDVAGASGNTQPRWQPSPPAIDTSQKSGDHESARGREEPALGAPKASGIIPSRDLGF